MEHEGLVILTKEKGKKNLTEAFQQTVTKLCRLTKEWVSYLKVDVENFSSVLVASKAREPVSMQSCSNNTQLFMHNLLENLQNLEVCNAVAISNLAHGKSLES